MTSARSRSPQVVLVDTDVVSYWLKGDNRGDAFRDAVAGRVLAVSFQTIGEQYRWAEKQQWGLQRRERQEELLKRFVVMPYSADVAREWARIVAHAERRGRPMACGDAWIAASALAISAPLATNNRKDFAEVPGLRLLDI